MSADRELLELAANAAGIQIIPSSYAVGYGFCAAHRLGWWNPLTDDGDAPRLATKLGMIVSHWPRRSPPNVMVGYYTEQQAGTNLTEEYGTDPDAATRRAIVRAAAETGRRMDRERATPLSNAS